MTSFGYTIPNALACPCRINTGIKSHRTKELYSRWPHVVGAQPAMERHEFLDDLLVSKTRSGVDTDLGKRKAGVNTEKSPYGHKIRQRQPRTHNSVREGNTAGALCCGKEFHWRLYHDEPFSMTRRKDCTEWK